MRRSTQTTLGALCGALAALAGPRCGPAPSEPEGAAASLGSIRATGVRWQLAWDATRVLREARGWSVVNDLGYRVTVTEGRMVTTGLSLHRCASTARRWWEPGRWLGPSVAWAEHGKELDRSAVRTLVVEDLASPEARALAPVTFPAQRYCEGHWVLSAPPLARLEELPQGVSRLTLTLRGTWSRGTAGGELELWTTVADGATVALRSAGLAPDAEGPVGATLTRAQGALFDGVDFATIAPEAQVWRVLENLVQGATLRLEPLS